MLKCVYKFLCNTYLWLIGGECKICTVYSKSNFCVEAEAERERAAARPDLCIPGQHIRRGTVIGGVGRKSFLQATVRGLPGGTIPGKEEYSSRASDFPKEKFESGAGWWRT